MSTQTRHHREWINFLINIGGAEPASWDNTVIARRNQHAPLWLDLCAAAKDHLDNAADAQHLIQVTDTLPERFRLDKNEQGLDPWSEPPVAQLQRCAAVVLRAREVQLPLPEASPGLNRVSLDARDAWLHHAALAWKPDAPPGHNWLPPDPIPGLTDVEMPVLLIARQPSSGTANLRPVGVQALLTLRAVHHPNACLHLVPAPRSACTALQSSMAKALRAVQAWLWSSWQSKELADVALCWDLHFGRHHGEDEAGIASLTGPSAGAAMAVAAAKLLERGAPARLAPMLRNLSRDLLRDTWISAGMADDGRLDTIGDASAKRGSLALMRLALAEGAGSHGSGVALVHVADGQSKVRDDPPPPGAALLMEHENIDVLLDFLAREAEPQDDHAEALLQALLGPDERPVVPDATLTHVASDMATHTLARWLLKCWAQWARRAGGQVHARYVPLEVQPTPRRPGQPAPIAKKDTFRTLQSLLKVHDANGHQAYVLRGRPGAGKSTLMRHHLMGLCRAALKSLNHLRDDDAAAAAAIPVEVPLYLPLATLPSGEAPLTWARNSLRKAGAPAEVLAWLDPKAVRPTGLQMRLMLDGINELQVDASRHELREDRAAETLRALREALAGPVGAPSLPALPSLLSIRTHHADNLTGVHLLPVHLLDWTDHGMRDYLALRFPARSGTRDEDCPWWPRWRSLTEPRHATAKAMCRVPLQLAGQCDLWAHGFPGTLTNRSALYTAWLWLRLRHALGHGLASGEQHTTEALKVFRQRGERWRALGLLSERDCRRIASPEDWLVPYPDALPLDGTLLQHLMRHAEAQYRDGAADGMAGSLRCARVDLPVDEVATWIKDSTTRQTWLDAVAELGLAATDETTGLFGYSHPSWGEFLASVRLLPRTPPLQLPAVGDGAAQHQATDTLPAYFGRVLTACEAARFVPPDGRDDASEVAYLNNQGSPAWQLALPTLRKLARPDSPLKMSVDTLVDHQRAELVRWPEGTLRTDIVSDWKFRNRRLIECGALTLDPDEQICSISLRKWGDWERMEQSLAAERIAWGPGDWESRAAGWQFLVHERLSPPVRDAIWAHLRQHLDHATVEALQEQRGRLRPVAQDDIDAVLALALEGHREQVPWLAWWLQAGHGARLAPAIPALLAALEPAPENGKPTPVRNPVLQHWRRLLLLDAMNTGPTAMRRLRASGLWHRLQDALQSTQVSALPPPASSPLQHALDAHWLAACARAERRGGLDLRQRMEAARLLGDLGDTIRFVRADDPMALAPDAVADTLASAPADRPRPAPATPKAPAGLRLHSSLWVDIGRMGEPTPFLIGSRRLESHRSERPVQAVWLPGFQAASQPVTVAEWRHFVHSGGYASHKLPWWKRAGPAAQRWLQDKQRGAGDRSWLPWFWGRADHDEPLLPATGITLFEALAYARWAEYLHRTEPAPPGVDSGNGHWMVRVPTELQWEAMARGPASQLVRPELLRKLVQPRNWAHRPELLGTLLQPRGWGQRLRHGQPQPLDFNHVTTRWGRPSPVGVFSASQTPLGMADMAGNTWDWCCSVLNEPMRLRGWRFPDDCALANTPAKRSDGNAQRAWRGGSFRSIAGSCRTAVRSFSVPSTQDGAVGLRLVRTWVPWPHD